MGHANDEQNTLATYNSSNWQPRPPLYLKFAAQSAFCLKTRQSFT